jgi:hypothetical protein
VLRLMREDNLLCLRQTPFVPTTTNSMSSLPGGVRSLLAPIVGPQSLSDGLPNSGGRGTIWSVRKLIGTCQELRAIFEFHDHSACGRPDRYDSILSHLTPFFRR